MKRKRFSVEQIVAVLKQAELGVPVAELIRQVGITEQTLYRWKKQCKGLETDHVAGCAVKKVVTPSRRRPVVSYLQGTYRVSERRACRVARIPVSTFRYESRLEPRTALRMRIREIAQVRVRYGYRKIRVLLNWEGWTVGKKLVYRLYKEEGLTLRHKPRRKRRAALHCRDRRRWWFYGVPDVNEVAHLLSIT